MDNRGLFVTGVAGSGKTTTINVAYKMILNKYGGASAEIISSTKSSACVVNGQTIHRYFGLGKVHSVM
jgi:hypothetical protein